jgi:hypothetical protein
VTTHHAQNPVNWTVFSVNACLLEVAQLARSAIVSGLSASLPDGSVDVSGSCLHASYLVIAFLERWHANYTPALRGGGGLADGGALDAKGHWRGHYWVEVAAPDRQAWIVDVTSDQFGWDPVTVGPLTTLEHRYRAGYQPNADFALKDLRTEVFSSMSELTL